MLTYISFLRGVNMAGHNKIKMAELENLIIEEGFSDAETYIQSGNIIFATKDNLSEIEIACKIESAIKLRFGYEIAALVRTAKALRELIPLNPFLSEQNFDPSKSALLFLYEKPDETLVEKLKDVSYPPDRFEIIGREIFIYCPNGFGRTKLYTNFFEKRLKTNGTARNWNTISVILDKAEKKKRS